MGIQDAGFIGTIHAFAYFLLGRGESGENQFELYSEYFDDKFHRELIEKYAGNESLWFRAEPNTRIAVKIIDDRGIESLKVIRIGDE